MFSRKEGNCVTTQLLEDTCNGCAHTWRTFYLLTPTPWWSLITVHHPVTASLALVGTRDCLFLSPGPLKSSHPLLFFWTWFAIFLILAQTVISLFVLISYCCNPSLFYSRLLLSFTLLRNSSWFPVIVLLVLAFIQVVQEYSSQERTHTLGI